MYRFALVALALSALATPAMSNRTPAGNLERAQTHVNALDRELNHVRNPHLRAQLEERVDRIERLLVNIERSGALDAMPPPRHRYEQRPQRPGHRPALLSFNEAMQMVRSEDFDRQKLETIRAISGQTRLSSREARAIAAELSFDSNQAEALIALYPSVTDPHRFRTTLDILEFGSNRRHVATTLGV